MGINLYKDLPAYKDEYSEVLNVVIDIPKYSSNKYEYDEDKGYFALDRVLYSQMFYPFDYWFVPQTKAEDGDAVDVIQLVTYPTFPGCVIKSRIIGFLEAADEDGPDNKIITVPVSKVDPRFDEIETYEDLPSHYLEELKIHFKEIKKLEKKKYDKVEIGDFHGPDVAKKHLTEAIKNFQQS